MPLCAFSSGSYLAASMLGPPAFVLPAQVSASIPSRNATSSSIRCHPLPLVQVTPGRPLPSERRSIWSPQIRGHYSTDIASMH
ncbi:hypothetical protein BCR44DRAFT_1429523 [Catenaria anguillulae PL171]|uniref:Uncharacterized protein n=1 Tax=Catenaria anguillulae PL171 TaxID=765915 RepID=A0A1Y2HWJ3_9FUNG|nr:hypothetical protein BCR44DRAFT_1429523 [Catenaria anguillulae PL171]